MDLSWNNSGSPPVRIFSDPLTPIQWTAPLMEPSPIWSRRRDGYAQWRHSEIRSNKGVVILKLKNGVVLTRNDSGAILLDTRKGTYWHLNETALALINALDDPDPVAEAVQTIVAKTGADPSVIRADIALFIKQLRRTRLIQGRTP